MKKKTIWKKRCGSLLAGALLTGAVALVGWQGIRSFSDAKTPATVHRLAAESSAVSAVSSSVSVSVPESSVSSSAKATRKAASSKSAAVTETTRTVCDVSTPMNLNTATAEELQVLPGIGEILAQRIVAYREQIGGFRNLEQLLEVNGIGTVKYAKIVPMLYLPEETPDEIDLNTATREELMRIPEMTETLADAILTLRQEIRYFSSPYELLYAEGMTDQRFEKLRDFVTVLPENRP